MDDYGEYDDEDYGLEREDDELYDDDYDSDNEDEDYDDDLDESDGGERDGGSSDDGYHDVSYYEALGMDDGRFDREHHMLPHSGFGSSVNLDELDEDQREAYELGYGIGAEDYDLNDDE